MKRLLSLVLLCSAMAGLTGCMGGIELLNFGRKGPVPGPPTAPRYQLTSAPMADLHGAVVVKMDTSTGEAWSMRLDGSPNPLHWEKIPN